MSKKSTAHGQWTRIRILQIQQRLWEKVSIQQKMTKIGSKCLQKVVERIYWFSKVYCTGRGLHADVSELLLGQQREERESGVEAYSLFNVGRWSSIDSLALCAPSCEQILFLKGTCVLLHHGSAVKGRIGRIQCKV